LRTLLVTVPTVEVAVLEPVAEVPLVYRLIVKPRYYALSELQNGARVDQGDALRFCYALASWLIYSAPLALAVRLANQTLEAKGFIHSAVSPERTRVARLL